MAEQISIVEGNKAQKYQSLLPQIEALVSTEQDVIANLANICAALKEGMGYFWVGFYRAETPDMLVLGPFQGPVACTRIPKGKGVCGAVFEQRKTLIVPNVDEFPGHIACSSASKSEIVLPIFKRGEVAWVLDIDSDQLNDFDEVDQHWLEKLTSMIGLML